MAEEIDLQLNEEESESPEALITLPDGRELYEHFHFTADRGQKPLRIDKYLVTRMERTSRNRIQQAADAGCIIVNGRAVKSSYQVKPDDEISICMDRPRYDFEIVPEDIPLDVVYEDASVLVVNKPAGLVVHPGHGNWTGTLVNALAYYFRDTDGYDVNDPRLGLVHRIDKDTSGLLVIAKIPEAKTDLGLQFFNKTTRRLYNALVWGQPKEDSGTVDAPIYRDPRDKLRMAIAPDEIVGKRAVTHYRTLEDFGYATLVECRLETGRTHQIRVHMASLGHPLFNDARYGGDRILRGTTSGAYRQFIHHCFDACPRQALHARTLGFRHPDTGEEMDFEAPLPTDFSSLLDRWRALRQAVR